MKKLKFDPKELNDLRESILNDKRERFEQIDNFLHKLIGKRRNKVNEKDFLRLAELASYKEQGFVILAAIGIYYADRLKIALSNCELSWDFSYVLMAQRMAHIIFKKATQIEIDPDDPFTKKVLELKEIREENETMDLIVAMIKVLERGESDGKFGTEYLDRLIKVMQLCGCDDCGPLAEWQKKGRKRHKAYVRKKLVQMAK